MKPLPAIAKSELPRPLEEENPAPASRAVPELFQDEMLPSSPSSESEGLPGLYSAEEQQFHQQLEKAATIVQKRFKGRSVRKKVALPSEILAFLNTHLKTFTDENGKNIDKQALSKVMAREIAAYAEDPTKRDKVRLSAGDTATFVNLPSTKDIRLTLNRAQKEGWSKEQTTAALRALKPEQSTLSWLRGKEPRSSRTFKSPVSFWVQKSPDGTQVELIGEKLGEGGLKEVFLSKPILLDASRNLQASDAVLIRAKAGTAPHEILAGQKALGALAEQLKDQPDFRVVGLLSHTDRLNQGRLEARDQRMQGDLSKLIAEQKDPGQILKYLAEAATTLRYLHQNGYVHGDVKPANIMIGQDGHAYVGDFDTLQKYGPNQSGIATPGFVDALAQKGFRSPTHDLYALAQTVALGLFGAKADSADGFKTTSRAWMAHYRATESRNKMAAIESLHAAILKVFEENDALRSLGNEATGRKLGEAFSNASKATDDNSKALALRYSGYFNLIDRIKAAARHYTT